MTKRFEVGVCVELSDLRIFLTLVDELHFARTAERLGLSPGRVSQVVSRCEVELGGPLFVRSSRRVQLTALGHQLDQRIRPALAELDDAIAEARLGAGVEPLRVRVAATISSATAAWTDLRRLAKARRPELHTVLVELPYGPDAYWQLRNGTADALLNWNHLLPPGLVAGPVLDRQPRVALLSEHHVLAGERSIEMAQVRRWVGGQAWAPRAVVDVLLPRTGHSGAATMEIVDVSGGFLLNLFDAIAADPTLAHATVASLSSVINRSDLVLVPIRDLPPLELVLIWPAGSRDPGLRALVDIARDREDR